MKSFRAFVILICLGLAMAALPAPPAHAATNKGKYFPVSASRLLDTRAAVGAPDRPLGAGGTLQLQVGGRGSVPTTGVAAVVLNLTATGGTTNSYLAAYPSGTTRPGVSSLNFVRGGTRANNVTVPVGTGGKIAIYNALGSVEVVADVLGYYSSGETLTGGNEFGTLEPERLVDTRLDEEGPLASKDLLLAYVDFGMPVGSLNKSVRAVALNITAIGGAGGGFLTTWDGAGTSIPNTSTLNYSAGVTTPNMAVVKTALCTDCDSPPPVQFAVYNGGARPVGVLIDLVGVYYNDGTVGLRFSAVTPRRISDSRTPLNAKPLAPNTAQTVTAPSTVAGSATVALVTNTTAVRPTASTYLTLYRGGSARPTVSNLNAAAGATVANAAVVELSTTNTFMVYNRAGTGHFLVDVTGRFDAIGTAGMSAQGTASSYGQVQVQDTRRVAAR
jgi:hypothetical protein